MYNKAIYCCTLCERTIKPPINFEGLAQHKLLYGCKTIGWMVFSNLEYLEYLYNKKGINEVSK